MSIHRAIQFRFNKIPEVNRVMLMTLYMYIASDININQSFLHLMFVRGNGRTQNDHLWSNYQKLITRHEYF